MKNKLTELVEQYANTKDTSIINKLEALVKEYSLNGEKVYAVYNDEGISAAVNAACGPAIVVFTEEEYVQTKGLNLKQVSINDLIKDLIIYPQDVKGLIFNPFHHKVAVDTETLLYAIFGTKKIIKPIKTDWPDGLVEYKEEDLVEDDRLLNLGIGYFGRECKEKNIPFLFCTNELDACPNVIIIYNRKPAFVYVDVSRAPYMPTLSKEKKDKLLARGAQFGFDCYYASISIGSGDKERFDNKILLKGEAYVHAFDGIQKIEQ